MHVKKIKAAGVPTSRAVDFVGEVGTLFYDHETGILRISDGHTPGGHLVYQDLTSEIGDIIPSLDLTYNLGSLTHQWRSLYVGTSTIYMGGIPLTIDTATNSLTVNGIPVGGGSSGTIWTNSANGCLRAELSATGFQAFTDATHLDLQDSGQWNVGSYQNSTFIGNDEFTNTNILSLRSGDETYITTNLRENGNHQWKFGADGNLTLPNGASIGSSGLLSGIPMTTDRGTVLFGNSPECVPTLLTHFHIMKEDASAVDLFLGDDYNYVKLPGNGETAYGVEIGTNVGSAYTWRFGTDGKLTVPGRIATSSLSGVNISPTNSSNSNLDWNFSAGGKVSVLTAPYSVSPVQSSIQFNGGTGYGQLGWDGGTGQTGLPYAESLFVASTGDLNVVGTNVHIRGGRTGVFDLGNQYQLLSGGYALGELSGFTFIGAQFTSYEFVQSTATDYFTTLLTDNLVIDAGSYQGSMAITPVTRTSFGMNTNNKYVFQIKVGRLSAIGNNIGVITLSGNFTQGLGAANFDYSVGFESYGVYNGPPDYATAPNFGVDDYVIVAVDRVNHKIWIKVLYNAGNDGESAWNSDPTADPTTNTGGFDLPTFGGAVIYPAVTSVNGNNYTDLGWTFGSDGTLTLPGGNTRIGDVNGSDAIVSNTGTAFGVVTQGTGGYVALEWVDNIENIGSTSTQVAIVVVNSPFASSTGTVQILTGVSTGTGIGSNIWEFGADGNLTIPDDIQDANGSVVRVATTSTAPTRVDGQLWFDNQEGRLYIKNDGLWLDASPTQIPSPETYLDGLAIDGTVISTANVDGDAIVIDGGDNTRLTVSNNSVTIQVPGGRLYWAAEFGGITTAVTTSSFTVGTGAFYDSVGNVYVLGGVQFDTNEFFGLDSLLLKYDTNGNLLWSRTWHDNSGANCGAVNQAFAIDSNDRIYWLATNIIGYGCWTGYMDTDGNIGLGGAAQESLGFVDGSFSAVDIACDNSGNYYLAGRYSDGNNTPAVIKVDGDSGAPIWTGNIVPEDYEDLPTDGQYRAVTVNPATGDVWAIGDYNDGGLHAMLSKWDINGTHQWTKELVTVTGDVAAAVIYNGGYVYTIVNDDPDQKAVVSKFNTDGVLIWASFLAVGELDPITDGNPGSYNTGAYDLSFDASGNVYVTGTIPGPPAGQSQLWITKLNPTNGEMLYSRILITNDGLSVIDSSGYGSNAGHRVGDIYQDKIVVTAVTESDINDSTGTNAARVMVAQLPIDGSVTGTFDNITIADITSDIDSICSTGTYTVTTLVWSTGTSTAITSTSSISVSTVTDVVGLTGETIALGSTASGTTTTNTWTFVNNNIILPPGGDILDSNGVSVLGATTSTTSTRWDATPTEPGNNCPIYAELTPDHFQAFTQQSNLGIRNDGSWNIGSNYNGTGLYGSGNTATLYSNYGDVAIRVNESQSYFTFGTDGNLTLPEGSTISDGKLNGMGTIRLEPAGASSATQALVIYPTAVDGNHIHLTADGGETDLYLGNDNQYVKVDHGGTIVVGTHSTATTSTWTFGTDGVLTLSTASTILGNSSDPNVYVETATTATTSTWTFGTNGVLTLPAATPVIKGGGTGTDVTIVASTGSNTSTWVFGANGRLTFPNGTVQTTAYAITGTIPTSSTSTGITGQIATTGTDIYICVGTNSWLKVTGSTF